MKLKNLLCVILSSVALQACVSTPSLNDVAEKLTVYPDNRVSFVSSDRLHAWSNDNNILALNINGRLINAKDIASIRAIDQRTTPKPLHIDVQLKTGEHIVDDVADWGYGVEWAACTPTRSCKYLDRPYQRHKLEPTNFPTFPRLLSTLADSDVAFQAERLVSWKRPSTEANIAIRQDPGAILPTRVSNVTLTFSPSFQIPNATALVEAEMKIVTAIAECVSEEGRVNAERERNSEAAFIRSNPSPVDVRNHNAYKAMKPNNPLTDWSLSNCSRKIRG